MELQANLSAKELGLDTSDLFAFQFTLAPQGAVSIPGFTTRTFGSRTLHHCPKLDVATIFDKEGTEVGYCLGVAVDGEGVRVGQHWHLEHSSTDDPFWRAIRRFAVSLAGRWLLIIRTKDEERIYGDACGMYNCIYDPKTGIIGSTLLMALARPIVESDEFDYRDTLEKGFRIPFGRTRDAHAKRLKVNHHLRLGDLTEKRFWQGRGELGYLQEGSEEEIVGKIKDRLGDIMAAITASAPTAIGVTGGNDSRNLIASGKNSLGNAARFFSYTHKRLSKIDYRSAQKVMDTLGYPLEQHPKAENEYSAAEIERRNAIFQASTGYCIGLPQMANVKLGKYPKPGELLLTGNVMECLRAAHWRVRGGTSPMTFGLIRCKFFLGKSPSQAFIKKWRPEFKKWYNKLSAEAKLVYIDLLFVEHNLPNLGTIYHADRNNFALSPFNDRRLIALSSQLPIPYRYTNKANMELLAQAAPELVDVPFKDQMMRPKNRKAETAEPIAEVLPSDPRVDPAKSGLPGV